MAARTGDYLFSSSLLKEDKSQDLVTRPLHVDDFEKGYGTLLQQLTDIEDLTKEKFTRRFREFQDAQDVYYIVVIEDITKRKIIAAATLFIEKKIVHGASKCGHIEDVVVDTTYRGKDLGKRVIEQLVHIGKELGCYKVILDCSQKNVPFYEKCGFKVKEVQMAVYVQKSKL